ncbi:MAG: SUMF1/EgtB/PvdO family nonheme iron enzyme [Roseibacillus sp.]
MKSSNVRPELTIPDHEVLRKIGGGAYGEVWLARGVTGALRAVKAVWYNDFEDQRGFEREFEGILKYEPISRDHPGLVHILHVGRAEIEGEPFYYYVMELGDDVATGRDINPVEYEPRTLRSDMKEAGGDGIAVEDCITCGRMLAEALQHLHENGLAHRDVKPSNVIFVDGKAKLADIGLVALRGQQTFVGTEGFVPPEGPGSAQADVYSLGKVLYEMATGKDRLDFPELPDQLPEGVSLKRWRALNSVICDICEPRISRRKIRRAADLGQELHRLEEGRSRPFRTRMGLVAGVLGVLTGMAALGQMISLPPLETASDSGSLEPPPLQMRSVTILSDPPGAAVYSEDGEILGLTPLDPRNYPEGSNVTFTLELKGYRAQTVTETVSERGAVIGPSLIEFNPPRELEPWEDVFGAPYQPEEDYHISQYYVTAESWDYFQQSTNRQSGVIQTLFRNGIEKEIILVTEREARDYVKWLETQCRETHLEDDQWFEYKLDKRRFIGGLKEEDPNKRKMHPFYAVVRSRAYAYLRLASKPTGANVYLQRTHKGEVYSQTLGQTPLEGDEVEERGVRVELNPKGQGELKLIVELPGFRRYERSIVLGMNEVSDEILVTLQRENLFDYSREPLENALGMQFIPVREDLELLASIWETRQSDFDAFVESMAEKVPAPKRADKSAGADYARFINRWAGSFTPPLPPDFADGGSYGPDHPVVNVTREDAELFCLWLTLRERKQGAIGAGHHYRLPTDAEWSVFVGLEGEIGEWPMDKHGQAEEFFWGPQMPPPVSGGNFADISLAERGSLEADGHLVGYEDGSAFTSPVASYAGRPVGTQKMYDLEGNVLEWVASDYSAFGQYDVARGACWRSYDTNHLKASVRQPVRKPSQSGGSVDTSGLYGFRVVLAKVPVIVEKEEEAESVTEKPAE